MVRALALIAILLAAGGSLVGCGSGQIRNEVDAIAAAKRISGLSEPITVLDVKAGLAGEIFNGPLGAVPDDMAAAAKARRERPAWRVDLEGFVQEPCADTAFLPCGLVTIELIIDRDTGEGLYSLIHG